MASLGTVTRGDTEIINLTIKNADGTARDITADTIKFTIKKHMNDTVPVVQKTVGAGIVKTNAAGGLAQVTLNPVDLASLDNPGQLYCDVEVTDASSRSYTTLFTVDLLLDVS